MRKILSNRKMHFSAIFLGTFMKHKIAYICDKNCAIKTKKINEQKFCTIYSIIFCVDKNCGLKSKKYDGSNVSCMKCRPFLKIEQIAKAVLDSLLMLSNQTKAKVDVKEYIEMRLFPHKLTAFRQ